jgi:hypothetical protein
MVAMMKFLRMRNGYSGIRGLRTFCITANLITFTCEVLGFGLFAIRILKGWGSYYLVQSLPRLDPLFHRCSMCISGDSILIAKERLNGTDTRLMAAEAIPPTPACLGVP